MKKFLYLISLTVIFTFVLAATAVADTTETLYPTTISIQQYNDADADGSRDPGENLIVEMYSENNYIPKGTWTFNTFLEKYRYATGSIVDGIKQESRDTASVQVVGTSSEKHVVMFGIANTCDIIAFTFNDADGNGLIEAENIPISGVPITLFGTDVFGNEVEPSTKNTDTSGYTSWNYLIPGNYSLTMTVPEGSVATTPKECTLNPKPSEVGSGNFGLQ